MVPTFTERHYTVHELREMWNLSGDVLRKLFYNEPGVMVIGEKRSSSSKRGYTTLRIPHSVAERVHRRMLNHS